MTWDLSPAVFRNIARRCHITVCFANVGTEKVVQRFVSLFTLDSTLIFQESGFGSHQLLFDNISTGQSDFWISY